MWDYCVRAGLSLLGKEEKTNMLANGKQDGLTVAQVHSGHALLWVGVAASGLDAADFSARGYRVETATNYREARARVQDGRYDALLLDLSASHDNGLRNLRRLKELDCQLDIIAVNGEASIDSAVQAIKAGAWDYLPHPLCVNTLAEKLSERRRAAPGATLSDPVVNYIREHATAISTRAEVALRFGLSSDTVSSRVRVATGKTFVEFLHASRLEEARHLLETTALNVSQIAARVGFSTSQHFARIFRRYSGLSPARYRLQRRANKNGSS